MLSPDTDAMLERLHSLRCLVDMVLADDLSGTVTLTQSEALELFWHY